MSTSKVPATSTTFNQTLVYTDAISSCNSLVGPYEANDSTFTYVSDVYKDFAQNGAWSCIVYNNGSGTSSYGSASSDLLAGCSYGYALVDVECPGC
ncbi:hypothetical protein ANO11243_061840 [Dothideomycetidae sp. 11243]|nr:hypothetical protein ANO11243_061840 [fungal sp. No.11243]